MIAGSDLMQFFYSSMTDDKLVQLIHELGLEQPVMDDEYDLYKETSTSDPNDVGIDLTFYELEQCSNEDNPCFDKISWDSWSTISLPFGLKLDFGYEECCSVLKKLAGYKARDSRAWVMEDKYLLFIHFKNSSLSIIDSVVLFPYREERIPSRYVLKND